MFAVAASSGQFHVQMIENLISLFEIERKPTLKFLKRAQFLLEASKNF